LLNASDALGQPLLPCIEVRQQRSTPDLELGLGRQVRELLFELLFEPLFELLEALIEAYLDAGARPVARRVLLGSTCHP
jgi:hypothetical protein